MSEEGEIQQQQQDLLALKFAHMLVLACFMSKNCNMTRTQTQAHIHTFKRCSKHNIK